LALPTPGGYGAERTPLGQWSTSSGTRRRSLLSRAIAPGIATRGEALFPNDPGLPRYSCWLDSQISTPARLISVTHRGDIRSIPARRGRQPVALVAERGRRLRVRPRQPGLRGPRETPPGPTTWVRPATGWWERMNAGESPWNQGRSVKAAPVRFQKAVSRLGENAAVERREARRSALWVGNPVR
jgi:hypothetical protein